MGPEIIASKYGLGELKPLPDRPERPRIQRQLLRADKVLKRYGWKSYADLEEARGGLGFPKPVAFEDRMNMLGFVAERLSVFDADDVDRWEEKMKRLGASL